MSENIVPQGDLTKLMLFFGRIPETHIQNLKNFPFIFFNGVTEVKIEHDIGTHKDNKSFLTYYLTIDQGNDSLDKRYEAMLSAVRSLFWKELQLRIDINGKEVFKSEHSV